MKRIISESPKFNYILVTAAKDEEDNLPLLIQTIAGQLLRPIVWIIIDDNSEDQTGRIVKKAVFEYPWIHSVILDTKHDYDLGRHYSSVCIKGFKEAIDYCEQNHLEFDYIALSDADTIYPINYFSDCGSFLQNNPEYGICSGRLNIKRRDGSVFEEDYILIGEGEPYGTGRVWRRQVFFDSGGYQVVDCPDTVSNIIAMEEGWKIKRLNSLVFHQTRDTAGKNGLWHGYFDRGEKQYYLHSNPLSAFNSFVVFLFMPPGKQGIVKSFAFLFGYCRSLILREERIENDAVKKYRGSYKRVFKKYWLFIKRLKKDNLPK